MRDARVERGRYYSDGSKRLDAEIRSRGLTHRAAEALVGAGNGQLSGWIHGDRRPSLATALTLQKTFGIPLEAWNLAAKASRTTRKAS